jgi:hypothetical protein
MPRLWWEELPDTIFYGRKDLKIVKTMFRKFRMSRKFRMFRPYSRF